MTLCRFVFLFGGEREREREGWNHNHPTKQLGKQREKETES